ncbi:MAG: RluA family pseudouridine synthase, partial [Planctomycetes bacterium]|nr:RluA family pseudouridine synthase [Planctomycetota bacterium]
VAVAKPEGLLVNMAENDEQTLQDQLRHHLRPSTESDAVPPSAVHRLDRYTSGAVLFGRTKRGLEGLSELLREGEIDKRYYALVVGVPEHEAGVVELPLKEVALGKKRMALARNESDNAMDSRSSWRVVETFNREDLPFAFSLLELSPHTGRKHQLRVHMAEIGLPIAGDTIYGVKGPNRLLREKARLGRHFLHARSLKFVHPVTHHQIAVEAKMPKDIVSVLKWLRGTGDGLKTKKP